MDHNKRLDGFFESMTRALDGYETPATKRLSDRMRKRARYKKKGLQTSAEATFLSNNNYVKTRELKLDPWIVNNARLFITTALEKFTKSIDADSIQSCLCASYLFDNWRYGPGASHDVSGTHICQKIVQDFSVTERCEPYVKLLRKRDAYFGSYDAIHGQSGIRRVQGSVLGFVPKNEDVMRTIATEPSGNMVLQLAAGSYLEGALRGIGLDIRSQEPKNKALARRGSIDGSLATIDLKSASDLIGIDLVRLLMPKEWADLLVDLRSAAIKLSDGKYAELNMISTMGNGFTFPLMTLIICSLLYAVQCNDQARPLWIDWEVNAVFGDDIIIRTQYAEEMMSVLTQAGFIVNYDKSFIRGPFRESCGGDYWEGVDITPFYVKSLANDADVYVAINQLTLWCAKHKLHLYGPLVYLVRLIREPLFIPEWHDPSEGILASQVPRKYSYLKALPPKWVHRPGHFDMPLALYGGLDSPTRSVEEFFDWERLSAKRKESILGRLESVTFTPRPSGKPGYRVKYKIQERKLPKCFLDGSDPISRGGNSHFISLFLELIRG